MQLTRRTRVAGAPVNHGIYQPTDPDVGPDDLLAALAADGYTGVDSGPIGFLGTGEVLARRLVGAGIGLAGGWVDLRFADAEGFATDLAQLEAALEVFIVAPVDDLHFAPRPTLACPGKPARMARPGTPTDPASALPAAAWPAFAARVQQAVDRCRDAGLEPVFHYHLGTDVETEAEADRLLALTDVAICLDTGHLLLAGGDPIACVHKWAGRIGQVHLKDADLAVHRRVREAGGGLTDVIAAGGFCALGTGDVDLAGVLRGLDEIGYAGWLVIEQDAPAQGRDADRIRADQRANLRWLEEALR